MLHDLSLPGDGGAGVPARQSLCCVVMLSASLFFSSGKCSKHDKSNVGLCVYVAVLRAARSLSEARRIFFNAPAGETKTWVLVAQLLS
jgi:hypothetical protein